MSPTETALHRAAQHGTPYVHRDGPLVVLVLRATRNTATSRVTGQIRTRMCSSAAMARSVAARVLPDMALFPDAGDPLAVSALYAEAAMRFACLRARREWRAT